MRTVAIGDLHLSSHTPREVASDAAALVRQHRGDRIVFVGDLLDLSADVPRVPSSRAIEEGLGAYPELCRALAEHVDAGGELRFVAGNHDPELGGDDAPVRIADVLDLRGVARQRIETTPWFFHEDGVHVEHGHLYDPDNAPAHPLVVPSGSLGVHFVEEFIAPTGAYAYLNKNDGTPLELFLSAFRFYGPRGPYVVYRYFHAAALALTKAGPFFAGTKERARGRELMDAFLEGVAAEPALVEALLAQAVTPTMESLRGTLARLYLDRVSGTIASATGLALLLAGKWRWGAALAAVGAAALATSWSMGHDRYGGHVDRRLADAGERLADATGASVVLFGHAHVATSSERYKNTGSFAFPKKEPGRPYVVVERGGFGPRAERRWFGAG